MLVLPWLNPFAPGPMAQAMPLLFAWVCAAVVVLALALDRQRGQHDAMVRAMVLAWSLAASLSAVIGLLQYFGATAPFGVWLNHTDVGAAFGNLRQRNQFATLLNLGLVTALWWAVRATARRARPDAPAPHSFFRLLPCLKRYPLLLPALLGALVSTGNAASSSRTGLLQLALLLVLTLWWQRDLADAAQKKRVQTVLLAALLAYAIALVALPLLAGLDPLNSGALARLRDGDAACASRLTLWGNVLHLIALKPLLGWGWGELDYAHFLTLYPGTRFCDILDNAHNLPLHLAVEFGVPAALFLCGGALWLAWRAQPWHEHHPTRQLVWALLAVILLHSLLEYPLWYGPFQTIAALCVWLLWWIPRDPGQPQTYKPFRPLARYLYALSAILLIAYCALAAWQYQIASQIYLDPDHRASAYRTNTLQKIKGVWLYQDSVRFAELTTADLDASNAAYINALAKKMLHFSPEARVVELLLESAQLLGRSGEVAFYATRFQVAFPKDYTAWRAKERRISQ